jgi:hypothetical protein
LTGLSLQGPASFATLAGLLGIPIALAYIKYVDKDSIFGIWLGATANMVIVIAGQQMIIHRARYEKIIAESQDRRIREESLSR